MNGLPCACGSGQAFDACCGPLISGEAAAETAEALMRSRYTAYSRQAIGYLEKTSSRDQRKTFSRREAAAWARVANFTGLKVVASEGGGPEDQEGMVEFSATYEQHGAERVLHERSRFVREDGVWRYAGGSKGNTVRRETPKVGRNDPCPCGSGRKYKKCCGR